MKALLATVATLAVGATTACSGPSSQVTAVEPEALIASASAWTPSDLTRDLPVDDSTRRKIETGVEALHASLLELHRRQETAQTLGGDARVAYLDELEADLQSLHQQHKTLWDSLEPAVRETLAARLHQRMRHQVDDTGKSLHERLRRLHGGHVMPGARPRDEG